MIYQTLNNIYGRLRGYDRLRIRHNVAGHVQASPEELAKMADELFQRRVHDAIRRFPLYAEKVKAFRGSLPGDSERIKLEELPIWTRSDQRKLFAQLHGLPVPHSFVHATGGSTGVPVQFYMTRESYEWRMAISDRGYSWAGAEEGRKSFYLWGIPIQRPGVLTRLKQGVHHLLQRRTYFDNFRFDNS